MQVIHSFIHSFIHCVVDIVVVVVVLDFVFLYNSQSPKGVRKGWTTILDGLGLAVMMAGGGREEGGQG
jgi:hypothetical protein